MFNAVSEIYFQMVYCMLTFFDKRVPFMLTLR